MTARIPVTLLTGFLGSGKTTLLAKLLKSPAMADAAVIVNEFGEVGLDHLLLERGAEDVVLLDSGCLCCAANGSLADTLADLHYRRLRKEILLFDRVIIETSGLADPVPILQTLVGDPELAKWYCLDGVVTLVDIPNGERQLSNHSEALRQVAVADLLIITKADVATPLQAESLGIRLAKLNPRAKRMESVLGGIDPAHLIGLERDLDSADRPNSGAALAAANPEDDGHAHHHDPNVTAFTLEFDHPLDWDMYAGWIKCLRLLPAEDLLRVKGIVAMGNEGLPHVIQGVQHIFGIPRPLPQWPGKDQTSRLVFITRNLSRGDVLKCLAQPVAHCE